jgi:hypothetical protein
VTSERSPVDGGDNGAFNPFWSISTSPKGLSLAKRWQSVTHEVGEEERGSSNVVGLPHFCMYKK